MKTWPGAAVILSLIASLSSLLHAQETPAPDQDSVRVAEYCQSLANGAGQAEALKSACQFALNLQRKLPNYFCDARVERRDSDEYLEDVIEAQVTVQEGQVAYSEIRVNGKPTEKKPPQGLLSTGEFGTQLAQLFAPENKASFRFKKEVQLKSRPALLFSFGIRERENQSFRVWNLGSVMRKPGYSGSLWLDKDSLRPVQISMLSTAVTSARGVSQYVAASTEYGEFPLTDGTSFLLPARASLKMCKIPAFCIRNEVEFRNCHKFRAKIKIVGAE